MLGFRVRGTRHWSRFVTCPFQLEAKNRTGSPHCFVFVPQLRKFRTSLSTVHQDRKELVNNYRPVQPLNDRLVLSSNPDDATVFTSPLSSPVSITIAAFIGVMAIIVLFRR